MNKVNSTYKDIILINYPQKVTVGDVESLLLKNDDATKKRLVYVIYHRLNNRYGDPLAHVPTNKRSGFLTMAISCLMIEAFQSFREGLEYTRATGAGQKCFSKFFSEIAAFSSLKPFAGDFYSNIRCGILHQAETYGNWRVIRRKGSPLFDVSRKAINADCFFEELVKSFENYCHELEAADWSSALWVAAKRKLKAICDHCNVDNTAAITAQNAPSPKPAPPRNPSAAATPTKPASTHPPQT
jgi:hypothetical protein